MREFGICDEFLHEVTPRKSRRDAKTQGIKISPCVLTFLRKKL